MHYWRFQQQSYRLKMDTSQLFGRFGSPPAADLRQRCHRASCAGYSRGFVLAEPVCQHLVLLVVHLSQRLRLVLARLLD